MKRHKSLYVLAIITLLSFGIQFGVITMASAAVNTDLSIGGQRNFANQAIDFIVCNNGPSSIKEIQFSINSTNIEYTEILTSPFDTPPTDIGSIDSDTLVWTGVLAGQTIDGDGQTVTECVGFFATGNETGNTGDEVTTTISIVSSVQVDNTINDDNSGNESHTFDPYTISAQPDLLAEARLVTSGTITPTSEVEYEIDARNIGDGVYKHNGFLIYAFALPPDATFVSATDLDPSDALVADSCGSAGILGVDIIIRGLEPVFGRHIAVCQLNITGGVLPANDTVYKFKIKIIAGASMAAGTADIVGILEGNDKDTMNFFASIARGDSILETLNVNPNNNVVHLAYDPDALQMTATRCPGQGETTSDGTACFRVSFNKDIYEPSFTTESLRLTGSGTVASVDKLGTNSWEVIITGITDETTLQLVDTNNPNSVTDYNAIAGEVFVLGESTIKFVANTLVTTTSTPASVQSKTTANGTLAATGIDSSVYTFALLMLILGLSIGIVLNRRKATA